MLKLPNLRYPVFIVSYRPVILGKTVRSDTGLLLDNKILPGDSLGKRRLLIDNKNRAKLKKIAYNFIDLIKKGRNKWLIDYDGKVVFYKTTNFVPLITRKIIKYKKVEGAGIEFKVETLDISFTCKYISSFSDYSCARILLIDNIPFLYSLDLSCEYKDTRLKI